MFLPKLDRSMPECQDIDHVLRQWSFQPGAISARLVRASDGREVLQMRIEMGVLQMETVHRPDGERPGGADTYLDYLIQESVHEGDHFKLSEEQCFEADREFLQFYHRRICWLAVREFERAIRDADHTLDLMDFVRDRAADEEWVLSHENHRPFVVFHRTQAAALVKLDKEGPENAVEEVSRGLAKIREIFERAGAGEQFEGNEMVRQLRDLQEEIRDRYDVGRTLLEQLADAVAAEQYELAARLRDKIARRGPHLP
jgi:hypothetical protein